MARVLSDAQRVFAGPFADIVVALRRSFDRLVGDRRKNGYFKSTRGEYCDVMTAEA